MKATTVRIRQTSHQALKEIAATTGQSLQDALEQAIEERRRRVYLEGAAADYAALKRDPKAWADYRKELEIWDTASADGLENK